MAIKVKSKEFYLKGIYLNIEKLMTQNSEKKIKKLKIDIFIPERTSNETIHFLKKLPKNVQLQEIYLKKKILKLVSIVNKSQTY